MTSSCEIHNPYLFEYEKQIKNRTVKENFDPFQSQERINLVQKYAWAIPDQDAIDIIADFSVGKFCEMGAGLGYWANLIWRTQKLECVDAYDNCPKDSNRYISPKSKSYYPIKIGDTSSCEGYDTLFLCWPPYNEPMASDCLKSFTGDRLIYVGEGYGGCTADEGFHKTLINEWKLVEEIAINQFFGIHDRLFLYKRIKN
jgi:hypothetical protein